jgi:hypothetical protein
LGDLGIKDLEKLGRAIRLRWFWYNWNSQDYLWKSLVKL